MSEIRFGLVSDSHYADKAMVNNKFYRQSTFKMKEFIRVMNEKKVDFIMHLGDLKDEDELKLEVDTLHYLDTIESIYSQFEGSKYHCIGNHDVDSITKQQFLSVVTNTGISNSESYYSFDCQGFHVVVLDASFTEDGKDHFFADGGDFQDAHIPKRELEWLQSDLEQTELPTLIFCHYLFFEYHKWGYRFQVAEFEKVRSILEESGKVIAVFHGHIHEEQHREINGIHYIVHSAMVDGASDSSNSFSEVIIDNERIELKGHYLASNRCYKL